MAKMKRKYKVLLVLGCVVIALNVLVFYSYIASVFLPKYEYTREEDRAFGEIDINGVIYKQVSEDTFIEIEEIMDERHIDAYDEVVIGKIDYPDGPMRKYPIYGKKDIEYRILLSSGTSGGTRQPAVYFCRQDVLEAWEAEQEE